MKIKELKLDENIIKLLPTVKIKIHGYAFTMSDSRLIKRIWPGIGYVEYVLIPLYNKNGVFGTAGYGLLCHNDSSGLKFRALIKYDIITAYTKDMCFVKLLNPVKLNPEHLPVAEYDVNLSNIPGKFSIYELWCCTSGRTSEDGFFLPIKKLKATAKSYIETGVYFNKDMNHHKILRYGIRSKN